MTRIVVVGFCLLAVSITSPSAAQDRGKLDEYGQGVHAYFAGEYQKAVKLLDEVIAAEELKDARPYYFRGLSKKRIGNLEGAKQDLKRGARIEVTSDEPIFNINRSLLRIQGADRIMVEGFRTAARKELARRQLRMRQTRYERMKRSESDVLFDPDRKIPEVDLPLNISAANPSSDPFLSGRAFETGDAEAVQPEISETPDIFGDTTPMNNQPQPADPFGGAPANPPAQPGNQPDPFGGQPAAPPAQPGNQPDPFGGAPANPPAQPGNQPDPFGGQPAAPPAQPGNQPDPFGGAPANPPAQPGNQPDPFGGGGQPPADGFPAPPAGGAGVKEAIGGITAAAAHLIGNMNKDDSRDPFGEDTTPKLPQGFPQPPQGGEPGEGTPQPGANPPAGQGDEPADPFDPFKK